MPWGTKVGNGGGAAAAKARGAATAAAAGLSKNSRTSSTEIKKILVLGSNYILKINYYTKHFDQELIIYYLFLLQRSVLRLSWWS